MVIVKRLYTFMLQRFLPLLAMTFFICLFIVLMQFLWKYVDELVGKGLSVSVIGELFFYAAITMVPTALPLAVLLASLMTFGNLGEKFELTALKAAGISLLKIMRPLVVFMVFLAIGAFFFQNYVLPVAQTKMWTLLFSVRQKSPEVEIPARSFYDQIPGMNLYVEKKNPETGMLYDMIIYDVSRGLDNSRVILADSGKLNFTEDKTHLFLHLYRGEMFENLRDNSMGATSSNYLPFRRESFTDKQIYFVFDANFNRMNEETMRNQYIGKNVAELSQSIDSIGLIVDSIGTSYGNEIKRTPYLQLSYDIPPGQGRSGGPVRRPQIALTEPIDIDTLFNGPTAAQARMYITQAIAKANRQKSDYEYRSAALIEQDRLMRRHGIELHRRFTLSFACLIFFFIGAPLGAIIKKGGIGTPLVISVFLFIIYFIFDNMGYKMARDGKVDVWIGIWLSSAVLTPLGIFFTYKAVGDSQVFNMDAYVKFFRILVGKRDKRSLETKEIVMTEVERDQALDMLVALKESLIKAQEEVRGLPMYRKLFTGSLFKEATARMNDVIEYLSNSRNPRVINLLNEYPFALSKKSLPDVISNTVKITQLISQDGNQVR